MSDVAPAHRASRSLARRKEVLRAAARVFTSKGYEAASINDIAQEVGIMKGSLYYYIDSKEELLFEVLRDVLDQFVPKLESWAASEGTAIDKLDAFIQNFVVHIIENRDAVRIFFQDFGSLSDKRRTEIAHERDAYDHFLIRVLRQGQEEGSIGRDVDLKVVANAIFGMMNWTYQWYRPTKSATPAEIGKVMASMAIHGLATDRPVVQPPGVDCL